MGSAAYFFDSYPGRSTLKPSAFLNCFPKGDSSDAPARDCLLETADSLLDTYRTQDLVRYTVASSSPSQIRHSCHYVAHAIGEETFKHAPNLETALAQCTDDCELGCWHGVIVGSVEKELGVSNAEDLAHADISQIQQVGASYCSQSMPTCHAIGHVIYANTGDMPKALDECNHIAPSANANACYSGTFMEAFLSSFFSSTTSLFSGAHASDLTYPCDSLGAKYQHSCFLYLPLARKMASTTYMQRVGAWHTACDALATEKARSDCFMGFGIDYERYVDTKGVARGRNGIECSGLGGIDLDSCVIGVTLAYAQINDDEDALTYCASLPAKRQKTFCYDAAFKFDTTYRSPPATIAVCDGLQSQAECRDAFAQYSKTASTLPYYYDVGLF